jgi:hypothetical protein
VPRSFTNARMISMFTAIALALFKTLDSIATPCSVNARVAFLRPPRLGSFEVTDCDFKLLSS